MPRVIFVLPSTISDRAINKGNRFGTPTVGLTGLVTFGADRDELHALAGNKIERFVHVGDLVEAHLATVRLGQRLARDHLEQEHQLETVAEVLLDVVDARAGFTQVRITPSGKRLRINTLNIINGRLRRFQRDF